MKFMFCSVEETKIFYLFFLQCSNVDGSHLIHSKNKTRFIHSVLFQCQKTGNIQLGECPEFTIDFPKENWNIYKAVHYHLCKNNAMCVYLITNFCQLQRLYRWFLSKTKHNLHFLWISTLLSSRCLKPNSEDPMPVIPAKSTHYFSKALTVNMTSTPKKKHVPLLAHMHTSCG